MEGLYYRKRRFLDALILTIQELRNFKTSSQKQSNGNAPFKVYVTIRLVDDVQQKLYSLVSECKYICTSRGAIRVARFDLMGNAKAFESWNERQELAPRSFSVCRNKYLQQRRLES